MSFRVDSSRSPSLTFDDARSPEEPASAELELPLISPALRDLVRDLSKQRSHSPASLAATLRRKVTLDDVAPYIQFDPDNYVRRLVARGDRWELRLLCWKPGQSSAMHGHGASACAFRILRGSAIESILGSRDRIWAPGDVIEETGSDLVHQVGNAGNDPLLTLHAYSPPLPVDAPSPRQGRNVVIVGGGLSGVAVALHLLRRADREMRIVLVERGPWLGRGVAYGVDSTAFRLNVPAKKMSLDPSCPDDFVTWSSSQADPDAFLPRSVFGQYVVDRFGDALRRSAGKLRIARADAVSVERDAVVLSDGTRLPADVVVLATGLAPRLAPGALPRDARIFDAWDECSLAALPRSGRLLILGAGLTALDAVAWMKAHDFSGSVTIASRRGLLPRPHLVAARPASELPKELLDELPRDLRALIAWGRAVVSKGTENGGSWQSAIDAMRPHLPKLWRGLPPRDRARFVRSVRPYWEVLRHRAPADALDVVEDWRRSGRLEVLAGEVSRCEATTDGLEVELRSGRSGVRRERYDAVLRCIGPALVRSEAEAPIVRGLVDAGRAAVDPAGLGILTDEEGHVLRPDGPPDSRLFAIGALRRASSWETTSVPDIVVHAKRIAQHVLAS